MSFSEALYPYLPYVLCLVAAYHMGSVNPAWLIAQRRGFEIRETGSRNAGTTNAGRTMGMGVAAMVFSFDVLKAALSVCLAGALFPESPCISMLSALFCVLGHMYPYYLEYRGGKGIAVLLGTALALNWRVFLMLLVWILVVSLVSNYMSVGTLSMCLWFLVWCAVRMSGVADRLIVLTIVGLIFFKHRSNLVRLFTGKELGLRQTFFGKKCRVKDNPSSEGSS